MLQLDFRKKKNGVPILKKEEIESLAEMLLWDYNPEILDQPGSLDIELFSESYVGLEMDYQDLTPDQSILGAMVFADGYVPVYDAENNKAKLIPAKEGTVIIDNSLLKDDQLRRGRFTLGHEIGHWLLHRHIYAIDKNQLTLFDDLSENQPVIKCRSTDIENTGRKLETDDDWMEWHADYMASALLMPRRAFIKAVNEKFNQIGLKNSYYELGTDAELDLWAGALPYELADIFDVSVTAAKIRLKNLNMIVEPQPGLQLNFGL